MDSALFTHPLFSHIFTSSRLVLSVSIVFKLNNKQDVTINGGVVVVGTHLWWLFRELEFAYTSTGC